MKQLQLPKSGKVTSHLAFGCAFPHSITDRQALYLLDAAYDAGIRHFDVAPFYVDGRAETFMGTFLAAHQDATVTTKYGLRPPSQLPVHVKAARVVLGPLVRRARERFLRPTNPLGGLPLTAKASYKPSDVLSSVKRSLVLLKRPFIDILLLHEADARDVEREGLLECLESLVSNKTVGAYGIGGELDRVMSVYNKNPRLAEVAQFNWDVTRDEGSLENVFRIFFRVVSRGLQELALKFGAPDGVTSKWSDLIGLDVSNTENVSAVVLKAALLTNPNGIVLTTSTDAKHILRNARVADDDSLTQPAINLKNILISGIGRGQDH